MEQQRKDFKVQQMQHQFKVERTLEKQNFQRNCDEIREKMNYKIEATKHLCEVECRRIRAVADADIAVAQSTYFEKVADIARREDEFNDAFRNYIATLPSLAPEKGGEQ